MALAVTSPLRRTMESAGYEYMEALSHGDKMSVWRKQMGLPSGRPKAFAVAVTTVLASTVQRNTFLFRTQLSLDGSLVSDKYMPVDKWLSPEEFVVHQVPSFGTLFELEDFYARNNTSYQGLDDIPMGPEVLVPLLTGEKYVGF